MPSLALTWLTVILAFVTALGVDLRSLAKGIQPPGFVAQRPQEHFSALGRRLLGFSAIALVLWLGVFAPLLALGQPVMVDFDDVPVGRLFQLHIVMLAALATWCAAGYVGVHYRPSATLDSSSGLDPALESRGEELGLLDQLGLARPKTGWWRELGLGVGFGLGAWAVALLVVLVAGVVTFWLGGEESLPKSPPPMVPWIAGLPILVRIMISLSAGVVEEAFFRGFLQRRLGVLVPSLLFVVAHANYGQPIMLAGITALSFVFAYLTKARGSVWAAMAAHTTFDAVQLLILIPSVLKAASESASVP